MGRRTDSYFATNCCKTVKIQEFEVFAIMAGLEPKYLAVTFYVTDADKLVFTLPDRWEQLQGTDIRCWAANP